MKRRKSKKGPPKDLSEPTTGANQRHQEVTADQPAGKIVALDDRHRAELHASGLTGRTILVSHRESTRTNKTFGFSVRFWWSLRASEVLPAPVRISGRTVRWRRDDLRQWYENGCPNRAEFERL